MEIKITQYECPLEGPLSLSFSKWKRNLLVPVCDGVEEEEEKAINRHRHHMVIPQS